MTIENIQNSAFATSAFGAQAIKVSLSQQLGVEPSQVEIIRVEEVGMSRKRASYIIKVDYRIVARNADVYGLQVKMQAADVGLPALLRAQSPSFSGAKVMDISVQVEETPQICRLVLVSVSG